LSLGSKYEVWGALEALHSNIALAVDRGSRDEDIDTSTTLEASDIPLLLPHLTELSLCEVDISYLQLGSNSLTTRLDDSDLITHHLTQYLKLRKDCGSQLEKLAICTPTSADVPQFDFLKGFVRDISLPRRPSPFLLNPKYPWNLEADF
jgi:hypothetical protein